MKTVATILLASVLTVACNNKKSGDNKAPKSPAESPTGTDSSPGTDGNAPGGSPRDTPADGATGVIDIDWSKPLRNVEIKNFHLMPVEKGKLSGYCIASSEKKVLPKAAEDFLKTGDGPCPETVELDGEPAAIQYVCPAHETKNNTKSQTILYAKIRTANGYESVKKIGSAIVNGFCDRSNIE